MKVSFILGRLGSVNVNINCHWNRKIVWVGFSIPEGIMWCVDSCL